MAAAPKGLAVSTDGQAVAGEWTMSATEFRAKCLGLIDEVAETGREIVITKRGRAVARLVPLRHRLGVQSGQYKDEGSDPRRHWSTDKSEVGGGSESEMAVELVV